MLLWPVLGIGAVIGSVTYVQWLTSLDPFAKYRRANDTDPTQQVGIVMKNVRFDLFDDERKIASCDVSEVRMRRDRSVTELIGIKNGQMVSEEGNFGFEAADGSFQHRTKTLSFLKGARIWNDKVNLTADAFEYYQRVKRLQTIGLVHGDFYGGEIKASDFIYFPAKHEAKSGPMEWNGNLAAHFQDVPGIDSTSQKKWNIKGHGFAMKGDIKSWTTGWATDGEVIISADKVDHNQKTDVVVATGNVKYFSSRSNLMCESATVYRKERRAVLSGNVTMLVKPKDAEKLEETTIAPFRPVVPEEIANARPPAPTPNDPKGSDELRQNNVRKYPTQVWAERIEYFYKRGSRKALISGNPQARQDLPDGKWRHLWSTKAVLDVETDWLRLDSAPEKKTTRLKTSLGDDLVAKWLRVSTKEGAEDEMEGEDVEGVVISEDEDLNNRNKGTPPPAAAPPLSGKIGA